MMITPNYVFYGSVLDIHDGDTVRVRVDQGFDDERRVWVRMEGDFSPELSEVDGPKFRDLLAGLMPVGSSVVVQTKLIREAAPFATGNITQRTTLSRYVGTFYVNRPDGTQLNVNQEMARLIGKPRGKGA